VFCTFGIYNLPRTNKVFRRFGQAELGNGGLVLGSNRFKSLPKRPQKTTQNDQNLFCWAFYLLWGFNQLARSN